MEDLRGIAAPELETSNSPKIMGAVVVILGVGALGAYTLSTGIWDSPSPRVIASREPAPVAPVKITAPVAPTPPAITPAPTDQRAADTTTAKAPTRVAHVHKSDNASPGTK